MLLGVLFAGSNKMHAIFVPFMHARVRVCVFWCVNWMLNTCGVCVLSHTISVGDVCFSHFFVRKTKRIRKLTIILLTEVRLCGVCCVCLFFLNNFPHYFILFLNSLSRALALSFSLFHFHPFCISILMFLTVICLCLALFLFLLFLQKWRCSESLLLFLVFFGWSLRGHIML